MGRPSSSSYQRANSFAANDIPIGAQQSLLHGSSMSPSVEHQTSTGPPPTPPSHDNAIQNMPSPQPHSTTPSSHQEGSGKYGPYPNDIEMQNRSASPYYHPQQQQQQPYPPHPQQQQMYYNNMYPQHPQQQQQQQPMYVQAAPVDIYTGHPLKRALLGPVRYAIFSQLSALAMLGMMIYELVRNSQLTGSVIQMQPNFNVMIGPSFSVLINMGAKFSPCMRTLPGITMSSQYGQCFGPNDTCTLAEMCGLPSTTSIPDQAYRFVAPIFMHVGVVHFLLNMLTHLRLGVDLERTLGLPRYLLLYMGSGIFGFVLSAMLSNENTASMGCSGSLLGLIGYMFIDVMVHWNVLQHPGRELASLLVSTIITLVLGLLPGIDQWAHVGGLVIGLVMGMLIAPMRPMASTRTKWFTWGLRLVSLAIVVVLFAVCIKTFYTSADPSQICPGCKYIGCLPVNGWCDDNKTGF